MTEPLTSSLYRLSDGSFGRSSENLMLILSELILDSSQDYIVSNDIKYVR